MSLPPAGDKATLTIRDVAYPGKGIGRLDDGCVVFVRGTLPGEEIDAEIVKRHKNYAEARLLGVRTPSPHRVSEVCPLSGVCPGCRYQHARYEEEVRLKQWQLVSLMQRMGGVATFTGEPPCASPTPLGYRNKIVLHASAGAPRPGLGYYAEDNQSIVDVPACPLAFEPINRLLHSLRADDSFLAQLESLLRVSLRWTPANGARHWLRRVPENARLPESWLTETTAIGPILVPPGSFFQVNPPAADMLLHFVAELVQSIQPGRVADLYCGVGVFALAAATKAVPEVHGIDSDPTAILAARENARARHLDRAVKFSAAPAERASDALPPGMAGKETLLIADPPRAGLSQKVIRTIARRRIGHVIYVSCAADTLCRDIRLLAQAGYEVVRSRLVDMFPRTPYFETVTLLRPSTAPRGCS